MNALLANPLALTILPPLVAGLLLGLLALATGGNRIAMAVGWGAGVLFVYWLLEGVPPVPPVAAKQKLGLLLALGALAAVVADGMQLRPWLWRIVFLALTAIAVLWLGWSKLDDLAGNAGALALAVAAAALLAAGAQFSTLLADSQSQPHAEAPFIVPAALLTTAIAGAVVSASGLFLGMAQLLGALAAMLGGALAVNYAALLTRGQGLDLMRSGATLAVAYAVLCASVMTALLAPSAVAVALLVLAAGPLLAALFASSIAAVLPNIPFLRPILAGAIIAIPAIVASLIAVLTGTSPFA